MNLKACFAAAVLAVGTFFGTRAEDMQFSTVESPVWYQIRFTTGGNALSDPGSGSNLVTAASSISSDAQLWQFIGNSDSFQLRSKKGNYVAYKSDRFASAAEATNMYIVKADNEYEMGRQDSEKHVNQWGGTWAGVELGEWNAGDPNNTFLIYNTNGQAVTVPVSTPVGTLPTFSNGDSEVWYFINFSKGGCVLASDGLGKSCLRARALPVDGQMWKVTGTADNAQFVNKAGEYLTWDSGTSGAGSIKTSASPYANGFSIIPTENSDYYKDWEILVNGVNNYEGKNYINQFGGTDIGGMFGL